MRLTDSGLQFVNDNLPKLINQFGSGLLKDGKFEQAIPKSDTKLGPITAHICPDGSDAMSDPKKCVVEADIGAAALKLEPLSPHALKISGPLPVRAQLINITAPLGPINAPIQVSIGKNADGNCASHDFAQVPIEVDISIEADTNPQHGTRYGLSRVNISKLDLNIDKNDIHICGKCDIPIVCNIWDAIIGGIGGLAKGLLLDQLKKPLQDQIDQALCIKGNPMNSPPCPEGSKNADPNDPASKCVFDDGSCASFALGTEGTLDLSGALSAFSPTTSGGLDFLFGVGGLTPNPANNNEPLGDLNPVMGGATLSLSGGAEPNPIATCVQQIALPKPDGIPTPDELMANTVPGWPAGTPGPHFGLAISERYANYAMGGVYNSGLLCVQITTEQVAQLNSKAIGLLVNSFGALSLQKQTAPVGLVLKPSKPPTVAFGNGTSLEKDPTLLVTLPQLGIDFYVWSSDRYIRAFTFTSDVGVPVNLSVTKDGLLPQLDKLNLTNSVVTNSGLLKEDPKQIAKGIEAVIGGAIGQALGGGALKPINLASALSSLGFTLDIPETVKDQGSPGLRKLNKGSDNFLGIFAGLGIAEAAPMMIVSETHGLVSKKEVKPEGMRLHTMTGENGPVVFVRAGSSAEAAGKVEYMYRVDNGFWHPWTTEPEFAVHDDVLRMQGKHVVHVKSRLVGQPRTESVDALDIPVTMDVDPPAVEVKKTSHGLEVRAADFVADDEQLRVRFTFDDQAPGEWVPYVAGMVVPASSDATKVRVEVSDEEGNIGQISSALRGKVDTTGKMSSGGCGCTIPTGSDDGLFPLSGLAIAGVLAYLRAARRRRARQLATGAAVIAVCGSWAGCSCSDSGDTTDETTPPSAGGAGGEGGSAGAGGMPAGGTGGSVDNPCKDNPDCTHLSPGLVGSYTSAAVASDGTVWVAGYNEADYAGEVPTYGDLVVGKYDTAGNKVAWQTVDGTDPSEMVDPTEYDIESWRGGKSKPGDDVGLWTSIQIGDGDKPAVAYYDVTHGGLKYAAFDGTAWKAHTVQVKPKGQIGRYAKMVMIDKKPVIAFMVIEPGKDGAITSGVRVARAKSGTPGAEGDWAFEDVLMNAATPCRAQFCDTGKKCNSVSGKCEAPVTGCMPKCGTDQECLPSANGPACQALTTAAKVDAYPNGTGLYVSAAYDATKKDIGIVFYDRLRGNLWGAQKAGASWAATLLDGQTGDNPGTDTGDVGIGASLAIDKAGNWHIAYVDGIAEALKYAKIAGGNLAMAAATELVDKGGPAATPLQATDAHVVGDDSSIVVTDQAISIAYQDATTGKLRVAKRPAAGGAWAVTEVKQDDARFAGFFSVQVTASSKAWVGNFWRVGGKSPVAGDVTLVPAP